MTGKRKWTEVADGEENYETGGKKDPLQAVIDKSGISPLAHHEENEEAVDDPGSEGRVESGGVQKAPSKKRHLKQESSKLITLRCEWNMCSAIYKKMEPFCDHITEHLTADCPGTSTSDGHVCIWRKCSYVCSSKDDLDRHVYFHAFHTKLKAIGAVLMDINSGQRTVSSYDAITGKRKWTEVADGEEKYETEGKKEPLQAAIDKSVISPLDHQEENEEAIDDPGTEGRVKLGGVQKAPLKKRHLKFEESLKLITMQCEWNMCSMFFKKMEAFCVHITEHLTAYCPGTSTSDGHVCIWRECGYICSSQEDLDRHVYFHAFHTKLKAIGTVLMDINSGQCVIDSSGRNMIPEIPELFQCMWSDCNDKFSSAQAFYWHVQSHVVCVDPDEKKQHACSWQGCTSVSSNQTRLSDHSRSHTQEKRVGCPNCGGIYCNNTKFFDHYIRQIPLSQQQYQCSHCSTKFASVRLLRDHVRRHINHFRCTECDMTCPTRSTLMSHVRYRHSDEKPHKCAQCDRCFKSLMDLNRHLSVHSEEPVFVCPYSGCDFACRAQSTLNKHIKLIHNGMCKEPYACHMCDSKYSLGIFLTRHLIKVHSFHWPSGHSRFRYKQDEDGFYRLQTIRYESIELMHEGDENLQEQIVDSPATLSAPPTPASPASNASMLNSQPLSQRDVNHDVQNYENVDYRMEKALLPKHPNSLKHSECQQIILPAEYQKTVTY